MPKKPMDYSKACVYKICCKNIAIKDVYVGSTTNLHKRRSAHKGACNRPDNKGHNIPVYQFIRNNGGWDNWEVIKIEDCPCECDEDLRLRERRWLETLEATLNSVNPFTGIVAENQEEYDKGYYQEHKARIAARHKVYGQEHREEILANKKAHYQDHKPEILAKRSEKVACEHCQSIVRKGGLSTHRKSAKCSRARGVD